MKTWQPLSGNKKLIGILAGVSFSLGKFEQRNLQLLSHQLCSEWSILFLSGLINTCFCLLQDNEGQTALHYGKKTLMLIFAIQFGLRSL